MQEKLPLLENQEFEEVKELILSFSIAIAPKAYESDLKINSNDQEKVQSIYNAKESLRRKGFLTGIGTFKKASSTFAVSPYKPAYSDDSGVNLQAFLCTQYLCKLAQNPDLMISYVIAKIGKKIIALVKRFCLVVANSAYSIMMVLIHQK